MSITKESMKTAKERVSYCLGLQCGADMRNQFKDLDTELLEEGFLDGVRAATPKLSSEEITSVLSNLKQQMDLQRKQYIAQIAEQNKKDGESFLLENLKENGIVTLSSGLQYKIIKTGTGTTHPTLFDSVKVHYTGSLIDGKVFDSSQERGEPIVFPLNGVISGWSEALQLMKIGDRWKIFLPHYLAYGEHGFGREIAPNSTLIFELELLSIE